MKLPDLVDRYGRVAQDIDAATVEALPAALIDVFMSTVAVAREAESADAAMTAARKAVTDAMRTHDAALKEDHAKNRQQSHQQALADVIAAGKPGYRPKVRKINVKAREALATAIVVLAEARADLTRAENAFRLADKKRSEGILRWINATPKTTQESIHREMCAADMATKLAIAKGELPAPVVVVPIRQYPIDEVLASRGKVKKTMPRGAAR